MIEKVWLPYGAKPCSPEKCSAEKLAVIHSIHSYYDLSKIAIRLPTLTHFYSPFTKKLQDEDTNLTDIKLGEKQTRAKLRVTKDQLQYEFEHLKRKLYKVDRVKYLEISNLNAPVPHPLFISFQGSIEPWEEGKRMRGYIH